MSGLTLRGWVSTDRVEHVCIDNSVEGRRTRGARIHEIPKDATIEQIAAAYGEVARLSLLAALKERRDDDEEQDLQDLQNVPT